MCFSHIHAWSNTRGGDLDSKVQNRFFHQNPNNNNNSSSSITSLSTQLNSFSSSVTLNPHFSGLSRSLCSSSKSSSNFVVIESEQGFSSSLNKVQDDSLPAIFYFTAAWCGPCKLMSPIIQELSKKYPNVTTYKIDVDQKELQSKLSELNISSVFHTIVKSRTASTMTANATHLIFHQRLNHYFKPSIFLIRHLKQFSQTLSPSPISSSSPFSLNLNRKFPIPRFSVSQNRRNCSSSALQALNDNVSGGRSGALSPPLITETSEKIDVNPPKGTRDFPPEEMRLRSWLFQNFREVSRLFGFEEIDFPVLESEALFIRKAGEEIRDQLYSFEDRGNRRVALRPELTPSLARLVIQKGKSAPLPLKWFAIGQCWRYERMTRGRRREHYQWNMDIIGVPEVTAEAELISSIVTFFKRLGITSSDVGFKVSSRKVLQEVLHSYSIPENLFGKVCIIIDKLEKIPMDEIKRELKSVGMTEEAIEELLQVLSVKSLSKLEEILGTAGDAIADLKQLFSLADKFGYSEWIQFDASVVRGLAYYTGIVFEGFDREGKLRAICGGGRYDRLLSTFGGDDVPACGFGFGDAVIVELLKEKGLLPELSPLVENIVCSLDQELQGAAATVATILREKGQSVDLVLESKPLKWVFKRAARINAERLILVGNSEWQKGMVRVKILATGEQYEVKLDQLE